MKTVLSALVISLSLLGCKTIDISQPSHAQQIALVRSTARIGTAVAIQKIYKNDLQKQIELAKSIKSFVDGIDWNKPVSIDRVSGLVSFYFPKEYRVYIQGALDILASSIDFGEYNPQMGPEPKVSQLPLTPFQLELLKAFFKGVDEGCDSIIVI